MSKAPPTLRPLNTDDDRAWRAYWQAQAQPWRTEPEIDIERQRYLVEHLASEQREWEHYPFKDLVLDRADIEWLLANYNEKQNYQLHQKREGLDLRGADLRMADLHDLPLKGVDLYNAHLEGADLRVAIICLIAEKHGISCVRAGGHID